MKRLAVALLALLLGLAACGDDATVASGGDEGGFPSGVWVLVEGTTPPGPLAPADGYPVTLEFGDDKISGRGGCNSYGGSAALDGDRLTLSEIFSTEMACADPAAMEVEQRYFAALTQVAAMASTSDSLTLTGEGVSLTFARDNSLGVRGGADDVSLPGGGWVLVEGTDAAGPISPVPSNPVTLWFAGGKFYGSGGCNGYGGSTATDGDRVTLSDFGSSVMACGALRDSGALDSTIMDVEQRYTDGLTRVSSVELSGDTLILSGADVRLTFRRDDSVIEPGRGAPPLQSGSEPKRDAGSEG